VFLRSESILCKRDLIPFPKASLFCFGALMYLFKNSKVNVQFL
jgi:hypothetical protein